MKKTAQDLINEVEREMLRDCVSKNFLIFNQPDSFWEDIHVKVKKKNN